jgi:hypothetical protein
MLHRFFSKSKWILSYLDEVTRTSKRIFITTTKFQNKMITYVILWFLIMIPIACISWIWVTLIDGMNKDNSDYKGLDLFDEEDKDLV